MIFGSLRKESAIYLTVLPHPVANEFVTGIFLKKKKENWKNNLS